MKIIIINGPNLNLLGQREPSVYGGQSFESHYKKLQEKYADVTLSSYQSNVEGELINCLQAADETFDGIILNAGGFSHTSVSIRDAVATIQTDVLEVHISNIAQRESFRHESLISPVACGVIMGMGMQCYDLGIEFFISM